MTPLALCNVRMKWRPPITLLDLQVLLTTVVIDTELCIINVLNQLGTYFWHSVTALPRAAMGNSARGPFFRPRAWSGVLHTFPSKQPIEEVSLLNRQET